MFSNGYVEDSPKDWKFQFGNPISVLHHVHLLLASARGNGEGLEETSLLHITAILKLLILFAHAAILDSLST